MSELKADSTLRTSRAVPHPSTNRALRRLTSEVRRDPVPSTRYGRQRNIMLHPSIPCGRQSVRAPMGMFTAVCGRAYARPCGGRRSSVGAASRATPLGVSRQTFLELTGLRGRFVRHLSWVRAPQGLWYLLSIPGMCLRMSRGPRSPPCGHEASGHRRAFYPYHLCPCPLPYLSRTRERRCSPPCF